MHQLVVGHTAGSKKIQVIHRSSTLMYSFRGGQSPRPRRASRWSASFPPAFHAWPVSVCDRCTLMVTREAKHFALPVQLNQTASQDRVTPLRQYSHKPNHIARKISAGILVAASLFFLHRRPAARNSMCLLVLDRTCKHSLNQPTP